LLKAPLRRGFLFPGVWTRSDFVWRALSRLPSTQPARRLRSPVFQQRSRIVVSVLSRTPASGSTAGIYGYWTEPGAFDRMGRGGYGRNARLSIFLPTLLKPGLRGEFRRPREGHGHPTTPRREIFPAARKPGDLMHVLRGSWRSPEAAFGSRGRTTRLPFSG
jgi:hypothetical protein